MSRESCRRARNSARQHCRRPAGPSTTLRPRQSMCVDTDPHPGASTTSGRHLWGAAGPAQAGSGKGTGSGRGMCAVMVVPPSGGLLTSSVPSRSATRSARPRSPEPRSGAAPPAVADPYHQRRPSRARLGAGDVDAHPVGAGVAGRVRQRLADDEVRGRLHRRREAPRGKRADLKVQCGPPGQVGDGRREAVAGQAVRVDPAGQVAQLDGRPVEGGDRRVERIGGPLGVRRQVPPRPGQDQTQRNQPLLGAVVQVAFQPVTLVHGGLDHPAPGGAQLPLGVAALGEVAQVRREHRGTGHRYPGDGQLDRKDRTVGPHPVDLQAPVQAARHAGAQVPAQASPMVRPKLFRDDELGELPAKRLLPTVAERAAGRGVELEDAAPLISQDHAVQRRVDDRPQAGLAAADGIVDTLPAQRIADAAAQAGHRVEELGRGRQRRLREELHQCLDPVPAGDREAERGGQAGPAGRRRAGGSCRPARRRGSTPAGPTATRGPAARRPRAASAGGWRRRTRQQLPARRSPRSVRLWSTSV